MADTVIAGRYRLIEPLGRGAMSAVWLAEDEELGRRVAVKMLAPTADRARFEREARAAASLSHPNISSLYGYGESEGRPYMVLEYLEGGTLEDRLAAGSPLPEDEVRRIAEEIAAGLAHAHSRGLVHRDMKPANILFDGEGRAKIADFGIARMGSSGTLTEAGTVLGTASYISPEQAAGLPAGPASDVYSFGVICFRMLTGRLPFVAVNAMELVRMHRDDPPPAIESIRPDVPADLAAIVTATLAKDPTARPPDGAALVLALRAGLDATQLLGPQLLGPQLFGAHLGGGPAAAADATQVLRPAAPGPRRRRVAPAAIVAVVVALLAGGGAAAWLATRSDPPAGDTPPAVSLTIPSVPTGSPSATTASTSTVPPTTSTAPTTTARATVPATHPTTTAAAPPPTTTIPPATTAAATTTTLPTTTAEATTTAVFPTTTAVTTDAGETTSPTTTAP